MKFISTYESDLEQSSQRGELCAKPLRGLGAPCGREISPNDPEHKLCKDHLEEKRGKVPHVVPARPCKKCAHGHMSADGTFCYSCRSSEARRRRRDESKARRKALGRN